MSRRNASRSNDASQSALLTMRAGLRGAVEVEQPRELRPDPGDVALDLLRARAAGAPASCRLGSPIMPVPPPTMAIGEWPDRCSRASPIIGQQRSDVQAVGGRIEADVAGHRAGGERVAQPFGRCPTPSRATASSVVEIHSPSYYSRSRLELARAHDPPGTRGSSPARPFSAAYPERLGVVALRMPRFVRDAPAVPGGRSAIVFR